MAKEKTLEDLFHDTLKDIYYAERKILKALPKMQRGAQAPPEVRASGKLRKLARSAKHFAQNYAARQETRGEVA